MLISIFASIGSQNLGDELILKNEIKILKERHKTKNPKFLILSYDIKDPFINGDDIEYKEYFPIDSKKLRNLFRNLKNFFNFIKIVIKSDLIVVGGGGIIYDNEKQITKGPLDSWLFRTNIFRLFNKKFSFFGVGINIKNDINLQKLKKIFSGAYKLEVRDGYSYNLLKKLGINSESVFDPVFFDRFDNVENGECRKQYINRSNIINRNLCLKKINSKEFKIKDLDYINFGGKNVGIALRRGYIGKTNNKDLEILFIKEIIEYIQIRGGKVILLPHSFHKTDKLANDYIWMKDLQMKLKQDTSAKFEISQKQEVQGRKKFRAGAYESVGDLENIFSDEEIRSFSEILQVEITNTMQETYDIYREKKIDICLAERLHSIILSNVYGIPFIAISYSKKTQELLKEF